jgi:DNA-binding NtrC family response regulator
MQHFEDELAVEQPLRGKRVLLAEDQEHLRTIIVMMIEELGAEVLSAEDGNSVLHQYSEDKKGIDLVLMDIKMDGLGGRDAFLRLVELDPSVRVVLTSGSPPDNELIALLQKHKAGFLEKPFNLANLSGVLSRVLSGEHVIVSL